MAIKLCRALCSGSFLGFQARHSKASCWKVVDIKLWEICLATHRRSRITFVTESSNQGMHNIWIFPLPFPTGGEQKKQNPRNLDTDWYLFCSVWGGKKNEEQGHQWVFYLIGTCTLPLSLLDIFSLPELLFSPLAQKISARFRTMSSIKIQHTWSKGFRGRRSIPVVGVNSKSPHQNI